jgi:phosphoenolpyruvate carboxylase
MAASSHSNIDQLLPHIFDKMEQDYEQLLSSIAEVVEELGEPEVARALSLVGPSHAVSDEYTEPLHNPEMEMHALSVAFQLLNLVEENAAAQTRRLRETEEGPTREPGLWGQNFRQLMEQGFSAAEIAKALRSIHVEPVLTAHPTESKRPTVLSLHRELYLLMVQLENQMWTPNERREIHKKIKATLERLWRTGEIYLSKPDVASERDNILYYLREVFPSMVERLDQRLEQAWGSAGLAEPLERKPEHFPRLRFGSWVGGDRDGHPLVTPEVTRESLQKMREAGVKVLGDALRRLNGELTLTARQQEPPANLRGAMIRLSDDLGPEARVILQKNSDEPWRQYINLVLEKLHQPLSADDSKCYRNKVALLRDLKVVRESLDRIGATRLADSLVFPVERMVDVFGLQMANLDIRQNSSYHDLAVENLLELAGFADTRFSEWPEEKRLEFLNRELASPRPFAPLFAPLGKEAASVLGCYKVLAEHLALTGGEGLGSLIISMTRQLSDLLVVYLLAREVGLAQSHGEGLFCPLPVVPLFETVDDLHKAPGIVEEFLKHPITKRSLRKFAPCADGVIAADGRPVQQVMVGYSDSNKSGGILAAQWNVHRAQKTLADVAAENGVHIRFFHGKGGTTSRGAGPTHRFLEALPHGSLTGHFRLTEQGETIAQKYANAITGTYNLELLLAGATSITLKHSRPCTEDVALLEAMEALSEKTHEAYAELIAADRFLDFWSAATPIDALEMSTIGSRPSRRTGRRTMEDLRAIPWVFSWTQSRYYLPGWYGIGAGMERLKTQQPAQFEVLLEKGARFSFLRYVLTNAETSIASADVELMESYAALVPDTALRNRFLDLITTEYTRTQRMIDEVFHAPREQRRPRMTRTLRLRDAGLRRLHRHQIRLLRDWRTMREAGDSRADGVLPTVLLSINAIASGLRTTG